MKPCANCGYPLDETESKTMIEIDGKMYADEFLDGRYKQPPADESERIERLAIAIFDFYHPENNCKTFWDLPARDIDKLKQDARNIADFLSGRTMLVEQVSIKSRNYFD